MSRITALTALAIAALTPLAVADECCERELRINEIRTAHPGGAPNEYAELYGPPGASLDCVCYVVIGPGGIIEEIVHLGGQSLDANGYFTMGEVAALPFWAQPVDLVTGLNFIDNGNRTHFLVCSCNGLPGWNVETDVDQNDDGNIDAPAWDCVLDCIALVQNPAAPYYCSTFRGPTPLGNAPSHVWRCQPPAPIWRMGPHDLATGVDTPDNANPACPGFIFGGLPHFPLGEAFLQNVGGALHVSNIGSSGEDGVHIELGRAESVCVALAHEDDQDSSFSATAYGEIDGASATLAEMSVEDDGSSFLVATHFGDTGELLTAYVLDDGEVVGQFDGLTSASEIVVTPITEAIVEITTVLDPPPITIPIGPNPFPIGTTFGLGGGDGSFTLGNGPATYVGDQLAIVPTKPRGYDVMTHVQVTSDADLTITGEMLGKFGNGHMASGAAQFDALDDRILVTQIGSSGLDGVCIDFQASAGLEATIDELPAPGQLDPQDGLRHALHNAEGELGAGTQRADTDGQGIGIFTDGFESGDVSVLVIDDAGSVVYEGTHTPGRVGAFASWAASVGGSTDGDQPSLSWSLDALGPIWIDNGAAPGGDTLVMGKTLLITPAAPVDPTGPATAVALHGTGLGAFAITGETLEELDDCPGDLNGDGAIDVTDILIILAGWGTSGPDGDLNGDGTIDVQDLLLVLGAWGACEG